MRKTISLIVAAVILALSLTSCQKSGGGKTDGASRLRIAFQVGVAHSATLLAKVNGYVEEELKAAGLDGVEVVWTRFVSGPEVNEAFAAGQQDVGAAGDVPLLVARASGQRTVTFVKASSGETTVALITASDSPITEPSQLQGKKVAFVRGSYAHHFLDIVLKSGGLTLSDVQLVNLPNADIGNAVAMKQVDAGVIWEPGLTAALSTNMTRVIVDGTGIKSNNVFLFTTENFANNNSEILKAFIRALDRANKEIAENPRLAANVLKNEISLDTELLSNLLTKFNFSAYISDSDIEELKSVEQFNRDQGLTRASVDIDQFVNRTFLHEAGITK